MIKYENILMDYLNDKKFDSFLEVGCGEGRHLKNIRNKFPKATITGIDIDENRIDTHKQELKESYSIDTFRLDASQDLLFKDKEFDLVFTYAVLIMVDNKALEKIVKNMKRIAKRVILIEVNRNDELIYGSQELHTLRTMRNYRKIFPDYKYFKLIEDCEWPGKSYSDVGAKACIIEL